MNVFFRFSSKYAGVVAIAALIACATGVRSEVVFEFTYADIETNKYDFQDTLIHELTHALGYLNAVAPGGGGLLEGLDPFSPQKWYYWDNFLADADTNRLVNASTFIFDADQLPTHLGLPHTVRLGMDCCFIIRKGYWI